MDFPQFFSDSNDSSPTRVRQMSFPDSTFYEERRKSSTTSRVMDRLNIEKADGGAGITIGKVDIPAFEPTHNYVNCFRTPKICDFFKKNGPFIFGLFKQT